MTDRKVPVKPPKPQIYKYDGRWVTFYGGRGPVYSDSWTEAIKHAEKVRVEYAYSCSFIE